MDFIDEPLVWDKMGPIQYIKHSFAAVISKLCSKLKGHTENTDIHITPEYKAKLDDLFKKVESLEAKLPTSDDATYDQTPASQTALNNEDYILRVVDNAGYIKDIPVCYVTREELPYIIPTT